jgi:integrase
MSDLRLRKGNAARCLEFTILTAARTAEALMAEWSEFDLPQRTWTIPAAKMKGREQHVVYLCDCVIEILEGQAGQHTQNSRRLQRAIFPARDAMTAYALPGAGYRRWRITR